VNNQLKLPEEEVDAKLISNLRRARLDFEEVGLQLAEVIAKFEAAERQQRLEKIKQKQKSSSN
jgi:hypothetical protein